jgi:hypothetical protein
MGGHCGRTRITNITRQAFEYIRKNYPFYVKNVTNYFDCFIETTILSACITENCSTECRVIFIKIIAACNFILPHLLQSLDDVHIYSQ